ncbi:MAG: hypothetical protein JNL82_34990 [Myxococcales bacterium]|nr:hypothetical protein [Myxococcales bacterium]
MPAALQLEWSAPAACPQAPDVRARIEAALRRPTRTAGPSATRVQARVTADTRGFALVLETRTAGNAVDVRRMHDRRCSVLADAAAVIVATAIDQADPNRVPPPAAPPRRDPPRPTAGLSPGTAPGSTTPSPDLSPGTSLGSAPLAPGGLPTGTAPVDLSPGTSPAGSNLSRGTSPVGDLSSETSPGPPPVLPPDPSAGDLSPGTAAPPAAVDLSPGTATPPTAVAPTITPPEPALDADLPAAPATPAPGPRLRGFLRLSGLADVGSTPELSGGLGGGGGLLGRGWRVHLAAVWLAPRVTRPLPDLDVRVGLLAAQLRGCAVPRLGPLEFDVCLGVEAGALRGSSSGAALVAGKVDWQPIVGAVLGPALVWPFARRLALVVQADLVVALARPQFAVSGLSAPVHQAPPALARALLGLEVRLP